MKKIQKGLKKEQKKSLLTKSEPESLSKSKQFKPKKSKHKSS